ncbi:MAG: arsenosugar biosynthesis radical SAM protein ArsS [Nitrospirae bacterium]|nr:arsenosugar biosynthesis radical SAM protein ArsS [Nitrospirota bacterium]
MWTTETPATLITFPKTQLKACGIVTLQVNTGYGCNQTCRHCHVAGGPERTEMLGVETIDTILGILKNYDIKTLDITGGAPELNPNLGYLIGKARKIVNRVIVRTNLTVLLEEAMLGFAAFYRDNGVELIASLPHYTQDMVDRVRGKGVFYKSIHVLRQLNEMGFGTGLLTLNLVYNPQGAFLPPSQHIIEEQFRSELFEKHSVRFDNLYTICNVPIGRFADFLRRSGNYGRYMERLASAFNLGTLDGVMCRRLVSVGWDGSLYDCDFNQAAQLKLDGDCPQHVRNFDYDVLAGREITTAPHCLACTAGQGSTCTGSTCADSTCSGSAPVLRDGNSMSSSG